MTRTALNLVFLVPLAIWTGAAVGLTLLTTPVIFASLDRDTAARLVAQLFPGYFQLGVICIGLALLAATLGQWRLTATGWRPWLVPATLAVILGIMLVSGLVIEPQIAAVQARITSFVTETDTPARQEFRRWHSLSSSLNVLVLLLTGLVWVVTAARPAWLTGDRRPRPTTETTSVTARTLLR